MGEIVSVFALYPYFSVMLFGDSFGDRQTQSEALPAPGRFNPIKALEALPALFRSEGGALVCYCEHTAIFSGGRQDHLCNSLGNAILLRIVQKDSQKLPQLLGAAVQADIGLDFRR